MLRELKVFWAALRTTPKVVNWFGITSGIILVVKVVWLNSIRAPLPVMGQLSDVGKDLLSANVAGYIFFVISFQLPQVIERRRLVPVIGRLLDLVANGVMGFLQMISGANGGGLLDSERVTLDEVKRLFQSVSPSAPAPMTRDYFSTRVNWLCAMAIHDEQCLEYIAKLWRYARFLDADLIALLDEIEFSPHSAGMRDARQYQLKDSVVIQNADLTAWDDNYFQCYDAARRLVHYAAEYRKIYGR
jgi:hypothetical protein